MASSSSPRSRPSRTKGPVLYTEPESSDDEVEEKKESERPKGKGEEDDEYEPEAGVGGEETEESEDEQTGVDFEVPDDADEKKISKRSKAGIGEQRRSMSPLQIARANAYAKLRVEMLLQLNTAIQEGYFLYLPSTPPPSC